MYDLSYHYDSAGDRERALAYALAAAAQARGQYALDVAAQQYVIAHRNAAAAPAAVRFRIARGRGEALLQLGSYPDARRELEGALATTDRTFDVADVRGLLGELESKLGNIAESIRFYEDAIRLLGIRVPKTLLGFGWGLAKQTAIQVLHSFFPGRLHRQAPDPTADLATHLLARVEWSYYCSNAVKLLWGSMVGINRAERVPRSAVLSVNYVVHANDMAVLGWHTRAARYYKAAVAVSKELNDQWGMAQSVNHMSMGCVAAAQYEEAIALAEPGISAFMKLGDLWELHFAYTNIAFAQYCLGNLAEAKKTSYQLIEWCVSRGDKFHGPAALCTLMRSSLGRMPFDELLSSIPFSNGNNFAHSFVLMAEGYWHTRHGRTAKAVEVFERAWAVSRDSFTVMTYNSSVLVELVGALRVHAESLERTCSPSGKPIRRRWQKLARWAYRLSWLLPIERPHALRELSMVYAYRGRIKKAWKLAAKSCRIAEAQKAKYEYARSLLLQGRLAKQLGRPEAEDQIRMAEAEIALIEGAIVDSGFKRAP